jgi:hypothetical protein
VRMDLVVVDGEVCVVRRGVKGVVLVLRVDGRGTDGG